MKVQIGLNSSDRITDITLEEVRRFDKYKDYTDEQVNQLIEAIKAYTRCIYSVWFKQKKSGKVIALLVESEKLKVA